MAFSRQEYWSELPCPSSGDLSNLGIQPVSLVSAVLQVYSLSTEPYQIKYAYKYLIRIPFCLQNGNKNILQGQL